MKNQHYYFLKTSYCAPFGWIQHESCTEMTANSTFRMANLPKYGLGGVLDGRKGKKACFGGAGSDNSLIGYRRGIERGGMEMRGCLWNRTSDTLGDISGIFSVHFRSECFQKTGMICRKYRMVKDNQSKISIYERESERGRYFVAVRN